MNYYPFNSRNNLYKSKVGAVVSGETLRLRLLLHNDAHVHNAYLIINRDGEGEKYLEMIAGKWLGDYRFYEIEIARDTGLYYYNFKYTSDYGDFFVIKQDNYNGIFSRENGEKWQLTVYSNQFKTPEHLKGGIIYQIFPDRFYKSGTNKRNVPKDRFLTDDWSKQPAYLQDGSKNSLGNDYYGGDLQGICQKLPYLKSLGCTVIYLNPIFEAHQNHRYNTADYMKIDPLLGDENDFIKLCKTAKEYGISIIIDGVFSHTGSDSIYFNKENRYQTVGAYNSPDSPYHSWYKWGANRDEYESWWGVKTLPEVNENDPAFTDYILGNNGVLAHWLRLGADGVRLDVADELPDEFLIKLRNTAKKVNPNSYILGEVWEDASNKISYGNRRSFLSGYQLDSVMNYPFASGIIDYIRNANAKSLCDVVLNVCENYPKPAIDLLMNHIGTHDTARILSVLSRNDNNVGNRNAQAGITLSQSEKNFAKKRLFAAAVIQYTLPGIPSVFYGDEAGMTGWGDPFCRATYPWGSEDAEILSFYKSLGKFRLCSNALKSGEFTPFNVDEGLLCFERKDESGAVFVAVNAGCNAKQTKIPPEYENGKIFGKKPQSLNLSLEQYEYCAIRI